MPAGQTRTVPEAHQALTRLIRALLSLRPLAETGHPVRLPLDASRLPTPVVHTAIELARMLGLDLAPSGSDGPFAEVVAGVLRPVFTDPALRAAGGLSAAALSELLAEVVSDSAEGMRATADVVTAEGTRLRSYRAGDPQHPPIVIASACGMPAQLCEEWMRFLSRDHFVITWETRGLFGAVDSAESFDDLDHGLDAQAEDLIAVMDHHGVPAAHVMGMCGGAVIAVSAAARHPERVTSLSLWHGDFSGSPGPTTPHQDNLKALLTMAGQSRADAAMINLALSQTTTAAVPPEVAHLVLYPYADDELFYRYCRLTGATMTSDVSGLLSHLSQPVLVVTSEDDETAHPGGSHRAATILPAAQLKVEPHGDHISVFGAGPRLRRLMTDFLSAAC
ncbi:MAG TPA: alpha/beta hydrolase [Micromonosporaceae bacterium]